MSSTSSSLKEQVIAALRKVFDPELPVNIHDLGLIYDLDVAEQGVVRIAMTLTSPNCPVADAIPRQVKSAVEAVPGVSSANVELVWEPPWSPQRMSERAKAEIELMGIDLARVHGPRTTNVTIGQTTRREQRQSKRHD